MPYSNRKLWYVAAPYSAGNDVFLSQYRKKQQELVIGALAALGVFCIDPLANHYVVETLKVSNGPSLPTDFAFWDSFCYPICEAKTPAFIHAGDETSLTNS